jgi:hypothetical protein
MGNLCNGVSLNKIDEVFIGPDLILPEIGKGTKEQYFTEEVLFNRSFKFLSLNDFIQMVFSFSPEVIGTNTLSDLILLSKIPILFKNKLFKNPLVTESGKLLDKDEDKFTHMATNIFNFVHKNQKSVSKKLNIKDWPPKSLLPVLAIIPLGFLYCDASYRNKFLLFFNLLTDKSLFLEKKSPQLYSLIYNLLIYPSNILIITTNELAKED